MQCKPFLFSASLLASSVAACAGGGDDPAGRDAYVIRAEGVNVDHVLARDGALAWTEAGAVRALDLASNQVTTLAEHTDGGPWGLARLGDSLIAGVTDHCELIPDDTPDTDADNATDCVGGPALIRIANGDASVLTALDEVWDPHTLAVIGDHAYVLSSGLWDPTRSFGCGETGQLIEISQDGGHRAIGPIEADPRGGVGAFGGIAYSVSDADVNVGSGGCAIGDIAGATRSIRVYAGGDLASLDVAGLDARDLVLLGGDADQLIAARFADDGASDILSIDRAGHAAVLGALEPSLVPISVAVTADTLVLGVLEIESSTDIDRCGDNPVPCLVPARSLVRRVARTPRADTVPDVEVAGASDMLFEVLPIGDRVFAATSTALLELHVDSPGQTDAP